MNLNPSQLKSSATYKHDGAFYSLCADFGRRRVFAGSTDYGIHVFDLGAENLEAAAKWIGHDNYVSALLFVDVAGQPLIVSGSYDRRLIWWDVDAGKPVREVASHDGWVRDLALLPDQRRLASVGDDMLVKLWDLQTGDLIRKFAGHTLKTPQSHVNALYALGVSANGRYLASADRAGEVRVWETETGAVAQVFQVPELYTYDPKQRKRSIGGIRSLAFSPDGLQLAAGGIGQVGNVDGLAGLVHVELWDWRNGKVIAAANADGHKGITNDLQFTPDGAWLVGGGGGSDSGFIASWQTGGITDAAPTIAADETGQASNSPIESGAEQSRPLANAHRIKCDGHVHRLCLNLDCGEIYAAGHNKLEVWTASK